MFTLGIYSQCSTYGETRLLIYTNEMCEKHCWKSDILREDTSLWFLLLPKMLLFCRCFSCILLV